VKGKATISCILSCQKEISPQKKKQDASCDKLISRVLHALPWFNGNNLIITSQCRASGVQVKESDPCRLFTLWSITFRTSWEIAVPHIYSKMFPCLANERVCTVRSSRKRAQKVTKRAQKVTKKGIKGLRSFFQRSKQYMNR
jgi:hypothetical protein